MMCVIFTQALSQQYEMLMNELTMTFAYTLNYDSLYRSNFGVPKEFGAGNENKYVVDLNTMMCTHYVNGRSHGEAKLLSFSETPSQLLFSFLDHGKLSNEDFVRYGVYNKKPRKDEPRFVLYYLSPIDKKTTVCHLTNN